MTQTDQQSAPNKAQLIAVRAVKHTGFWAANEVDAWEMPTAILVVLAEGELPDALLEKLKVLLSGSRDGSDTTPARQGASNNAQLLKLVASVIAQWDREFGADYPSDARATVLAVPDMLRGLRLDLLREDVREELLWYLEQKVFLESEVERLEAIGKQPTRDELLRCYRRIIHELVRPDNGHCNQCGGHWIYDLAGRWNYAEGEHTPDCVVRQIVVAENDDRLALSRPHPHPK